MLMVDQVIMQSDSGREETIQLYQQIEVENTLDISSVQGGTVFMSSYWWFGVASNNAKVSFAANFSATLRLLVAGSIDVILINTESLMNVVVANVLSGYESPEAVIAQVEAWTFAKMQELLEFGP